MDSIDDILKQAELRLDEAKLILRRGKLPDFQIHMMYAMDSLEKASRMDASNTRYLSALERYETMLVDYKK